MTLTKRYAYRLKGSGTLVTKDYRSPSPATAAVNAHIIRNQKVSVRYQRGRISEEFTKAIKEVREAEYERVEFTLVETTRLQALESSSKWLGHLEDAGVDNWEGIGFAYELQGEAKDA